MVAAPTDKEELEEKGSSVISLVDLLFMGDINWSLRAEPADPGCLVSK